MSLRNHAPSGPSLRIGAACGARFRLNGRSAGEDWKVEFRKGILKRGEWFFSLSALFSFTGHEAISAFLQGRKLTRRTCAGQREKKGHFPSLPPRILYGARAYLARRVFGVSPQHCFRCSLFVFSPRRLFPALASQNPAEEGCGFESGSDERARQKQATRAQEKHHSEGFFRVETHPKSSEQETWEARFGRDRFETF